jgi:hypothetical protein
MKNMLELMAGTNLDCNATMPLVEGWMDGWIDGYTDLIGI